MSKDWSRLSCMLRMGLTGAKMALMAKNSKSCRQGKLVPMKQEKPVVLWLKSKKISREKRVTRTDQSIEITQGPF